MVDRVFQLFEALFLFTCLLFSNVQTFQYMIKNSNFQRRTLLLISIHRKIFVGFGDLSIAFVFIKYALRGEVEFELTSKICIGDSYSIFRHPAVATGANKMFPSEERAKSLCLVDVACGYMFFFRKLLRSTWSFASNIIWVSNENHVYLTWNCLSWKWIVIWCVYLSR